MKEAVTSPEGLVLLLLTYTNERKTNGYLYTIMARRCQITYPQTFRPLFHRSVRW